MPSIAVEEIAAGGLIEHVPELAGILLASVHAGASVGFVPPFTLDDARSFWSALAPALQAGHRRLLVARCDGRIAGTVQLVLQMPANGRHRAEISKLLVHPAMRRNGIGRTLMLAAEELAASENRSLLLLDTRTGDDGERLYLALGYQVFGIVPGYACSIEGRLEATTFMYKRL